MGGHIRTREEKLEIIKYHLDNPDIARYKIPIIKKVSRTAFEKWLKEYKTTGDIKEITKKRKTRSKTCHITTALEPELADFVAELAYKNNIPISQCLRKIILYHYKKAKGTKELASA